jgi:hypothetical protein
MDTENQPVATESSTCAECGTNLPAGMDQEVTEDGVFCRPCFNNLTHQLHQAIADTGTDINYSMAFVGGLVGAVLGVVAWWGFTVVTKVAFGLVAVVIGFAVGKGVVLLSGGKRHLNLQIMSVLITTAGFFYASYLVNRTFVMKFYEEQGQEVVLPFLPDPSLFVDVLTSGFGVMDLVFLGIAIFQAWSMTAPIKLSA